MGVRTGLEALGVGLCLAALVRMGLLPRTAFRAGRRTLAWWLNSVPFWLAGTGMLAVLLDVAAPWPALTGPLRTAGSLLAPALAGSALVLIGRAGAAHRVRPALWQQPGDRPEHLVTTGPYALVRHPFYAAFLLVLAGCLLAAPHWSTLAALAAGAHRLNGTAAAEEARFLASELGTRYAEYARRTGRFVPRVRGPGARARE